MRPAAAEAPRQREAAAPIRREARAMGSPLRLQAITSEDALGGAWDAVLMEFEATEAALSRFRQSSEIERARRALGHVADPSRRLAAALAAADRARRVTNGRFDPRIITDLERLGSDPLGSARIPGGSGGSSSPRLRVETEQPIVTRNGRRGPMLIPAPVDFGGIGKGLALRWAARRVAAILEDQPFLLEAGGDLVGQGVPDPLGWRIGIEDPFDGAVPLAIVVRGPDGFGVATSSVRRARWQDPAGRAVHHLIDPATGEPGGGGLAAVTVAAPDPAWAEVWSKSLFLEGTGSIAAVARGHGLAAWWVDAVGRLEMTPAARQATVWVLSEAA